MSFSILSMSNNQLRALCELVDPNTDFSQWEDEGDAFYRDMLLSVLASWFRHEQAAIARYFKERQHRHIRLVCDKSP